MTPYYRPQFADLSSSSVQYTYSVNEDGSETTIADRNTVTSENVLTGFTALSCGPLVKGDFKTPNPWSYSKTESTIGVANELTISGPSGKPNSITQASYQNPFAGDPLDFGAIEDRAYNELVAKFYEKIRGNLDLSTAAFQAKQTARMFSLVDQVEKYTTQYTKRKVFNNSVIKKAGGAWLEYVYGIKPLVSDIYQTAVESLDYQQQRADSYTASAKATEEDQVERVSTFPGNTGRSYHRTSGKSSVAYTVRAAFNLQSQTEIDRFTSLNPLSIAWELTPYSFVADWFTDVGGYLRDAETAVLYAHRFKSGSISRLEVVEKNWNYNLNVNQVGALRQMVSSYGSYKNVNFSRGVMLGSLFPRPPTLDIKLGASRMFSAAALLSQLLGAGTKR